MTFNESNTKYYIKVLLNLARRFIYFWGNAYALDLRVNDMVTTWVVL
jgi:hypothetical protein